MIAPDGVIGLFPLENEMYAENGGWGSNSFPQGVVPPFLVFVRVFFWEGEFCHV